MNATLIAIFAVGNMLVGFVAGYVLCAILSLKKGGDNDDDSIHGV